MQCLGLVGLGGGAPVHSDRARAGWAWEAMSTLWPRAWGPQSSLHVGVVLTASTIWPRANPQVEAMRTKEGNVPFSSS